jgi:prepilin-type processing-associated H-X9-DG protein
VNLTAINKPNISYFEDVTTPMPTGQARLFGVPAGGTYSCGMGDVYSPSETPMLCDAIGVVPASFWPTGINEDPRHNDGLNVSYADGHVKWARPEQINIGLH